MLVLAHRGLHDDARENSLAAFEAAVAAGVDGIETDVRLTKDGVAVLFHDAKIGRKKVADITRDELARRAGYRVASLEEALLRFDVLWDVEIKSRDAVAATAAVLRKFAATRRFFVTSFRKDVVARVARLLPGVDVGRIVERAPVGVRRAHGGLVVWRHKIATRRRVRRQQLVGGRVFVYGAKTPRQHVRCIVAGVDGVITDWPDRVRAT